MFEARGEFLACVESGDAAMSGQALPWLTVSVRGLLAGTALMLAQPAIAAPAEKPKLPDAAVAMQQQHARWVAAFNGWRNADWTWRGEKEDEAAARRSTTLLILPTPTPVLSRQRRLDGRSIVISSGLIALMEELLLAEAVYDKWFGRPVGRDPSDECFRSYANIVRDAVETNLVAPLDQPSNAVRAWPRFAAVVENRKRAEFSGTGAVRSVDDPRSGCESVTLPMLRTTAMRRQVEESVDSLALWLFTRQNLELSRLPPIVPSKRAEVPAKAGSDPVSPVPAATVAKGVHVARVVTEKKADIVSAGSSAPPAPNEQAEITCASVGGAPPATPLLPRAVSELPIAASAPKVLDVKERVRLAVCSSGRSHLRTADWLLEKSWLFDRGSSPPAKL